MSVRDSLKSLNFDLENKYPGLKESILSDYKNQKMTNKILYLKLTLLFYYPSIYYQFSSRLRKGVY